MEMIIYSNLKKQSKQKNIIFRMLLKSGFKNVIIEKI